MTALKVLRAFLLRNASEGICQTQTTEFVLRCPSLGTACVLKLCQPGPARSQRAPIPIYQGPPLCYREPPLSYSASFGSATNLQRDLWAIRLPFVCRSHKTQLTRLVSHPPAHSEHHKKASFLFVHSLNVAEKASAPSQARHPRK